MGPGNASWILNREQKRDPKKQLVMLLVAEEGAWRRWEGAKGRGQLQSLSKAWVKWGTGLETGAFCDAGGRTGGRHTARAAAEARRQPKAHAKLCLGVVSSPLLISVKLGKQRAGLRSLGYNDAPHISARRASQPPHFISRACTCSYLSSHSLCKIKNNTVCSLAGSY